MRLPSVPGPRDVLQLVERSGEAIEQLLATVPRVGRLLDRAERLLLDVEELLARIDETRKGVDTFVGRIAGTQANVDALVARAELPVRRIAVLLDGIEPSLVTLRPTLERLAETTDPREIDALVGLIDHLPLLVLQLERDILPVMNTLGTVAPDIHDMLDASRELNEMLGKLPGMGRIKRKVDEEQAAEERAAEQR